MNRGLIPTQKNVRTITDMRVDALGLLRDVRKRSPFYIFYRNKPRAVILSLKSYKELVEQVDKLLDMMDVIELDRKEVKEENFVNLNEFKKSL